MPFVGTHYEILVDQTAQCAGYTLPAAAQHLRQVAFAAVHPSLLGGKGVDESVQHQFNAL